MVLVFVRIPQGHDNIRVGERIDSLDGAKRSSVVLLLAILRGIRDMVVIPVDRVGRLVLVETKGDLEKRIYLCRVVDVSEFSTSLVLPGKENPLPVAVAYSSRYGCGTLRGVYLYCHEGKGTYQK